MHKRSCPSPISASPQSKRSPLVERLSLADRIEVSGLPRGSPCQFCFFNNLSCWVAGFSVRCSQYTRADRSCTDVCPLMDPSVPINIQASRITLDHCLSFLDQDVLRIRNTIDSLRRQELSRILAGIQFPCASEESLNSGYR